LFSLLFLSVDLNALFSLPLSLAPNPNDMRIQRRYCKKLILANDKHPVIVSAHWYSRFFLVRILRFILCSLDLETGTLEFIMKAADLNQYGSFFVA